MKREDLLKKKNVVYVRRGKKVIAGTEVDRDCLTVAVTKKVPLAQLKPEDRVPGVVEGIETDVIVDEMPQALRKREYRPMPGGVSVSHPNTTAGTGSPIPISETKHLISNEHVIAGGEARVGDMTWQPGRADGGRVASTIGHLFRWVPIYFHGDESDCPVARAFVRVVNCLLRLLRCDTRIRAWTEKLNTVDCAISKPIGCDDLMDTILGIGVPTGFAEARVLEGVKKSGRTTGVTHGTVLDTDGAANVHYGARGIASFKNQIITSRIAEPGDSGSLVLNGKNEIVGMLFAGTGQMTIVNKISNVVEELGLKGG